MPVKVTEKAGWSEAIKADLKVGVLKTATDIHRRSISLAPVDTRALVNSGKIKPIQNGYAVHYGSKRVPYARIQELGGVTGKGYHTHITAKHYLGQAGDSVARGNIGKYFG